MKALTLCFLLAFALPCVAQEARNPNHTPPENIWWSDAATYTATLGAGATFDFTAAAVTLGAVTAGGSIDMANNTLLNVGSAGTDFTTSAATISTTAGKTTQIGNSTGTFQLDSDTIDISTLGAITGATGIVSTGTAGLATVTVSTAFTSTPALKTVANLGTKGAEVTTATEYGDGYHHTTVLTGISMLDAVTSTGTELVGGIAYTFPEGAIVVHSVMFDGKVFAPSLTDTAAAFAVGTAVGSAGLTTTEQDLLITGALDGAITTTPGVVHQATSLSSLNGAGVTPAYFDGTASAIVAYINMTDTSWGVSEDVTITGSLTIVWDFVGDF